MIKTKKLSYNVTEVDRRLKLAGSESVKNCYTTNREAFTEQDDKDWTSYLYGLYDALVDETLETDKRSDGTNKFMTRNVLGTVKYLVRDTTDRYIKDESGNYVVDSNGYYVKDENGDYVYYDTWKYVKSDVKKYVKDSNGNYVEDDSGDYVKDQNGNYIKGEYATLPIYEYVFSPKGYTTGGNYAGSDLVEKDVNKPKYLLESGIHGGERAAAFGLYLFIRDFVRGERVPTSFRDGVTLHVVPIVNPFGFKDAHRRYNPNGVDINRNFDSESDQETQIIANWIRANKEDADLFIDTHNSSLIHEMNAVISNPYNYSDELVKHIALRGIDRVIPYWKDVIGYPKTIESMKRVWDSVQGKYVHENVQREIIYAYPGDMSIDGAAIWYASSQGIPSMAFELSMYYGNISDDDYPGTSDTPESTTTLYYHPETVAMTAEMFGNALIEIYNQHFIIDTIRRLQNN